MKSLPLLVYCLLYPAFLLADSAFKKTLLPNGLVVITHSHKLGPTAAVEIRLNAGSNRETLGDSGKAHFFEHMLFRKAKEYPEGDYDSIMAKYGGHANAYTSTDTVDYHSVFPVYALDEILDREKARMISLDLQEPYFSVEKGAVLSERRMHVNNSPVSSALEFIHAYYYMGTPYEWNPIGFEKDIESLNIPGLQKFYDTYYVPNNAIIGVSSPLTHSEMLAKVRNRFEKWESKPLPNLPKFDLPVPGKKLICQADVKTHTYLLTYPLSGSRMNEKLCYEKTVLLAVFNHLLNDSPEGSWRTRLTQNNIAIDSGVYANREKSPLQEFNVYTLTTKEQSFEKFEEYWNHTLEEILKRELTDDVKNNILTGYLWDQSQIMEKPSRILSRLIQEEYDYGRPDLGNEFPKTLKKLTSRRLRQWIKTTFVDSKPTLFGVESSGSPCSGTYPLRQKN